MSRYGWGENPNSLAALREFGPQKGGGSRNPGGLVQGTAKVSVALGKLLRCAANEAYPIVNKADELAVALHSKAVAGDMQAISIILDRSEGRVSQTLNIGAAELPTGELVERLIAAFGECGIDEPTAQRVLLQLGAGE